MRWAKLYTFACILLVGTLDYLCTIVSTKVMKMVRKYCIFDMAPRFEKVGFN